MAILKAEALLLRRYELRETSLVLVMLTREMGKITGLIKGVRGKRGISDGYFEPVTIQRIVFYERPKSAMELITQVDLVEPFMKLREDLTKIAYASYLTELTDHILQIKDPHPEVYDLLSDTLKKLETEETCVPLVRFYEARLLSISGLLPSVERLGLSKGAAATLAQLMEGEGPGGRLKMTRQIEEELTTTMQRWIIHQVDRRLKSLEFLRQIGESAAAQPVGVST